MKTSDVSTKVVLSACAAFHSGADNHAPWKIIMSETGAPEKVVHSAMNREEKAGNIDCGVSLRTGWLTDKGRKLLTALTENEKQI
jgi:hypothetical protein